MQLLKLAKGIIGNTSIDAADKTRVLELAIAEVLAKNVPVPATAFEEGDLQAVFDKEHKAAVQAELDKINELYVLDYDQTTELVLRMWETRYMLVHDVNNPKVARAAAVAVTTNPGNIDPVYSATLESYPNEFINSFSMKRAGV